jgi:hypothetical protein
MHFYNHHDYGLVEISQYVLDMRLQNVPDLRTVCYKQWKISICCKKDIMDRSCKTYFISVLKNLLINRRSLVIAVNHIYAAAAKGGGIFLFCRLWLRVDFVHLGVRAPR